MVFGLIPSTFRQPENHDTLKLGYRGLIPLISLDGSPGIRTQDQSVKSLPTIKNMKSKHPTELGSKHKIGKITIAVTGTSYRLRWSYLSQDFSLSIHGLSLESWAIAQAKAQSINKDILLGIFDPSLTKYRKHNKGIRKEPSIKGLWEQYKQSKQTVSRETTKNDNWKTVDRALMLLTEEQGQLDKLYQLGSILKPKYSDGTLKTVKEYLTACLNWAKKAGIIAEVPYIGIELKVKKNNLSKSYFTAREVLTIIKAFRLKEPHYACFVEMIFLTGRRYEDIIALTWDDISKSSIKFDKAKSNTAKTPHETKNATITLFPINKQIFDSLERQKDYLELKHYPTTESGLIYPSPKGTYINGGNFLSRHWKPLILDLVDKKEISQYLPLYYLRHSRATHLIQNGVDLQTIAVLLETSIEMLSHHYLGSNTNIDLPEL